MPKSNIPLSFNIKVTIMALSMFIMSGCAISEATKMRWAINDVADKYEPLYADTCELQSYREFPVNLVTITPDRPPPKQTGNRGVDNLVSAASGAQAALTTQVKDTNKNARNKSYDSCISEKLSQNEAYIAEVASVKQAYLNGQPTASNTQLATATPTSTLSEMAMPDRASQPSFNSAYTVTELDQTSTLPDGPTSIQAAIRVYPTITEYSNIMGKIDDAFVLCAAFYEALDRAQVDYVSETTIADYYRFAINTVMKNPLHPSFDDYEATQQSLEPPFKDAFRFHYSYLYKYNIRDIDVMDDPFLSKEHAGCQRVADLDF